MADGPLSSSVAVAGVCPYPRAMHVALLRGINVGGRNKLPMAELAALFEAEGCTEVRTYIQSGNVVFAPPGPAVGSLAAAISARIEAVHAMSVPVVLRSAAEMAAVVAANPFLARGADPATLHVAFLSEVPDPTRVARLDPQRSPPDEIVVVGADAYLHLPGGMARTRITNAYLDRALAVVSTARNWRTVMRLAEMVSS